MSELMLANRLKSDLVSMPQKMVIREEGMPDRDVLGFTVSNDEKPGSYVLGYCEASRVKLAQNEEVESQRIVASIKSSTEMQRDLSFDFFRPSAMLKIDDTNRDGCLMLKVTDNQSKKSEILPIMVAPGAVALAEGLNQVERNYYNLSASDGIFDTIFKGVTVAVPHLATAAYNICKELGEAKMRNGNKNADGLFQDVGSIIDVAVPFLGSLI